MLFAYRRTAYLIRCAKRFDFGSSRSVPGEAMARLETSTREADRIQSLKLKRTRRSRETDGLSSRDYPAIFIDSLGLWVGDGLQPAEISPSGSGNRPPEPNRNTRDKRPLDSNLPMPDLRAFLRGGRFSAPGSVYLRRLPPVNRA